MRGDTLKFRECKFVQSSDGRHLPKANFHHVVLIGRSNVGKSSLVNHLFNDKSLARVSQVPGKTELLNFFSVDDKFYLVDLPGYGFTKRSKTQTDKWESMVERYLLTHLDRIHFLHLIDSRHPPSKLDHQFMAWAEALEKKVLYILTKIDKINKTARKSAVDKYIKDFGEGADVVPFTIYERSSREHLITELGKRIDS